MLTDRLAGVSRRIPQRKIVITYAARISHHQVEPDPAEMAERYGADTSILDWRERLVCSECGSREVDMVVSGTEGVSPALPSTALRFPFILCSRIADRLPLHVRGRVRPSAHERHNVIFDITGARAAGQPGRWTRVRQLEFALDRRRSMLSAQSGD